MREIQVPFPGDGFEELGVGTRESIVPVYRCDALRRHRMLAAGISEARRGFSFFRRHPDLTLVQACTAGEGEVWVGGRWQRLRSGMAYLTPPRAPHAYRAIRREPWRLTWVCYGEPTTMAPVIGSPAPVIAHADPRSIDAAVRALYREFAGPAEPELLDHLATWVHLEAGRWLRAFRADDRLWNLWQAVDADLSRSWTLEELARRAGLSIEQLRVQCVRTTGRSPMRHVTHLRMRRAAAILAMHDVKLVALADMVGYRSAFAFSNAFKRDIGMSPRAFRAARGHR